MQTAAPELAIRLRRATFNQALAAADLTTIAAVLSPDAVLITGTDSAVLAGRKAQLQAWRREFAAPVASRNCYTRTPTAITLSPVAPVAMEQGEWVATAGGQAVAGGSYSAKWRLVGGDWVIEAEIFVTLA